MRGNMTRFRVTGMMVLILGLAIGTSSTASASTASAAPPTYAVNATANVRTEPSGSVARMGTVFAGERVEILCQDTGSRVSNGSNLWDFVQYQVDGTRGLVKRGWVADYLISTGRTSALPDVKFGNCPPIQTTPTSRIERPPSVDPPRTPRFDDKGVTDRLLFGGMSEFLQAHEALIGNGALRWDSDGCSVPIASEPRRSQPRGYDFRNACLRHDFGLHNYDGQKRLDETSFQRINDNFKNDMYSVCNGYKGWQSWKGVECRRIADVYTKAVRECGAPWSRCMERIKRWFDWI